MTNVTLEAPHLTRFESAMEEIHSKPERLLEFNSKVAFLLQQLCGQWPDLTLDLSDSPNWSLYAGCHEDHEKWNLGRCDGEDGSPVRCIDPAYLNGFRFGKNQALSHQELRQTAFKGCGWTERDHLLWED